MPGILSVGRLLGGSILGFSPRSLFAASEPGGWYDPSDLTTLFQDAAGTTPVTAVEQPVGLVLDKSKGLVLGSELVTNGDFSNGTTGWGTTRGAIANVGGELQVTNSGVTYARGEQPITCVVGKWYEATALVRVGTTPVAYFDMRSGTVAGASVAATSTSSSSATKLTLRFLANNTTIVVVLGCDVGTNATAFFDNISVRELPGNHLSQSTSTARPVLSARVNLLTRTEELTNAVWSTLGSSVASTTAVTPPTGVASIFTCTEDSSSGRHLLGHASAVTVPSGSLTISVAVRKIDRRYVTLNFVNSSGNGWFAGLFDLDTGLYLDNNVSSAGTTQTFTSGSAVSLGDNWYRLTIAGTTTATSGFVTFAHANAATYAGMTVAFGNPSFAGTNGNATYVSGFDLRPANAGVGLPAYQRVGAATSGSSTAAGNADYDTTGFPLYLKFDGTDDFLVSGTISPGSVDKAQIFAGVRKITDTGAAQIIAETSSQVENNAGSFALTGTVASPSLDYRAAFQGSSGSSTAYADASNGTYDAPVTSVLAGLGGISTDTAILRVNGTQVGTSATDQGTGNYGNYALCVGSRFGSSTRSLFLNGHIYSLIIRFSATNMDAATIASTETWVNSKTGAY